MKFDWGWSGCSHTSSSHSCVWSKKGLLGIIFTTVAHLCFSHSSLPAQLLPSCSLLFKLANTSLFMHKLDQTGSLCGCAFVLCVVLNCHERAHSWNTDALCPFSVSLCKHVLAKHTLTLDLTQTQNPVQKSPTAALDYIDHHRQKKHTISSGHWLQP